MTRIDGARLLADLRRLATFGRFGTGVDRTAFSPPDIAARDWLCTRMREGGLDAAIDGVGNVVGRSTRAARSVVIGSHTDSVPKGGWLDGALGVIYGLEIARARREAASDVELGVDVVSFQDEEGSYLPFLGSRAFCGDLAEAEIAGARGREGETLAAALARAGYGGAPARRDAGRHVAFLEAHIEQGPRLEAAKLRLGVVTGIVGIRRLRVSAAGQADHAGTTPMAMRRDAARPLYEIAARVHDEFGRLGGAETVWNVGTIAVRPGAANVVPAEAEMIVEFRDLDPGVLDRLEARLLEWVAALDGRSGVALAAAPVARVAPTPMTEGLARLIEDAAGARAIATMRLPSGAGHDATILGRVMPAAMLFIPSIGGRSHDIVEDTDEADIVLGCEILADVVDRLAAAAR